MTARGDGRLPPVRSTFSRRVRGVLSPYRERGNSALARRKWGEIPAYAGMTAGYAKVSLGRGESVPPVTA